MTKYRNYKEPYNIDVKRFSVYSRLPESTTKSAVDIGDEVDVVIREMDSDGRGIAFYKGYKVIVPKGFVDERVRVRIVRVVNDGLLGIVVHRYGIDGRGK